MRITGGRARGIPLLSGKREVARPATDRMREAVFSSLGEKVVEARFFDLFAGTGAYGLEAWSRGAVAGVFVEKNRSMVQAIQRNIEAVARSLGADRAALQVVAGDVARWMPAASEKADLIFVDPPYERIDSLAPGLFERFRGWLSPDGVVVFEMPGMMELTPEGWECVKRLGKGRHQPSCALFRLKR